MIPLQLPQPSRAPLRILCLGAHSDDIEIGSGGTILKLLSGHKNLEIHWVVFGAQGKREREARQSSGLFLRGARKADVVIHGFRDGFFPYVGGEIKDCFEDLKRRVSPDIIFTHQRNDLHQDHRLLCELTWNTFRNHVILEYEVPKYDGDLGSPNLFVPLAPRSCERKIRHLLKCFGTQRDKHWFSRETFLGLMRLRGMEACSPTGYAEAFYSRKLVLG